MKVCYPDWWLEFYGPEDLQDDSPDYIDEDYEADEAWYEDDEDEHWYEDVEDEY